MFSKLQAKKLASQIISLERYENRKAWDEVVVKLKNMGKSTIHGISRLEEVATKHRDYKMRSNAIEGLNAVAGVTKQTVGAFVKALQDNFDPVRWKAADALTSYHDDADVVVPALVSALSDKEENVRKSAIKALANYGAEAKDALPKLISFLTDLRFSSYASETIDSMGLKNLEEDVILLKLIADREYSEFKNAAKNLTTRKKLISLLDYQLVNTHLNDSMLFEIKGLLNLYDIIGATASGKARDQLRDLANWKEKNPADRNRAEEIRTIAHKLLFEVKDSGKHLIKDIEQSKGLARSDAMRKCFALGDVGSGFVHALAHAAEDFSDGMNQEEAIDYLARLGASASTALPVLQKVLRAASRPCTPEDFREQQETLGKLPDSVWRRIEMKEPIDPKLARATKKAIEAIESGS